MQPRTCVGSSYRSSMVSDVDPAGDICGRSGDGCWPPLRPLRTAQRHAGGVGVRNNRDLINMRRRDKQQDCVEGIEASASSATWLVDDTRQRRSHTFEQPLHNSYPYNKMPIIDQHEVQDDTADEPSM